MSLASVSILLSSFILSALATPCVVMDVSFNLLAFGGPGGKDYNAGQLSNWKNGKADDITTSGRPPFDASNTVCYLSQFQNSIYVTNGDKSKPDTIAIYDVDNKSWSSQKTSISGPSEQPFDDTAFTAILDHDTNVFFALSGEDLWQLDMAQLTKATSASIPWTAVDPSPYGSDYSKAPVMALANNHIHFFDVPNDPVGDASIFVIHYAYFQPSPQAYPLTNGDKVPTNQHGQAFSMFLDNMVQREFGFVPDDGSGTYVVDVTKTNTTQNLAAPPIKDSKATYFGGPSSIVQLASNGIVSYLPYNPNDKNANSGAKWQTVAALPQLGTSSTSNNSSTTLSGSGTLSSGTSSPSSTGTSTPSSGSVAEAGDINTLALLILSCLTLLLV